MARHTLLVLGLAAAAVLGGCIEPVPSANDATDGLDLLGLVAGDPLWNDPQNAPHPAFGWPTLSSPPNATDLPAFWQPIPAAELPADIQGLEHVGERPKEVLTGAGIALFGSLAVVPGFGDESYIVDLSDPTSPRHLATFAPQEGMGSHRGATIIAYPDGRLVTVIATGAGLDVWDITDPTQPMSLPPVKVSSHKVGVVPGTPIVYNAGSDGGGLGTGQTTQTAVGKTQIYDFTDPAKPVLVQDWENGFSCHHVYFWNDAAQDKFRAICAGIEYTQIWDTKDPLHPEVIVSVPVHHGTAGTPSGSIFLEAFSHYAGLSADGKILLVGDENGGGGIPPGCGASASTPAGAASTPIGALWFYDVSVETSPKLLGWYSPLNDPRVKASPATSCTAHHGRLVPAEGRDMIAMSFYGAGVVVVDFTDVDFAMGRLPHVVDQFAEGSDTWETWYHQGYLVTGDLARGMDVLKFN